MLLYRSLKKQIDCKTGSIVLQYKQICDFRVEKTEKSVQRKDPSPTKA